MDSSNGRQRPSRSGPVARRRPPKSGGGAGELSSPACFFLSFLLLFDASWWLGVVMEHVLVVIAVFAVFVPALILPGPDFVAVVRSAVAHGAVGGFLTTLGVTAGLCLYATLSLVGLSAVLVEYQWLTWVVRVLGGGYLVWLGIRLLRTGPVPLEVAAGEQRRLHRPVVFGFVVTLTNPKAIVLFASVFATAVTAATPGWLMAVMIGLVGVASLGWYSLVSCCMASGPVLRRLGRMRHWIERTAGACFIVIGGKVMADARNPITP
jgi:threonine efflux protein